jgi:hypothetical protein
MNTTESLQEYLKSVIWDYELRAELALNNMNRMRCSLEYADPELYEEMYDIVEEWCDDNGVTNDFDMEELL